MNSVVFKTLSEPHRSAWLYQLPLGVLQISGRDRSKYLQGQISNDVLAASPGQSLQACLLNNTGHLLAVLTVFVFDDYLLIATDSERVSVVSQTLERFIVRERVEIKDAALQLVSVQGDGAGLVVSTLFDSAELPSDGGSFVQIDSKFGPMTIVNNPRLTSVAGFDLLVQTGSADGVTGALISQESVVEISDLTWEAWRIEAGEPTWGSELDESIIPLEAGLESAISYTKGCYMGQEIIARIHSRGHTNRSLVGLRSEAELTPGTELTAVDREKAGQVVGRITSSTVSQTFGNIALGYVRNEYAEAGSALSLADGQAVVTPLPFSHG